MGGSVVGDHIASYSLHPCCLVDGLLSPWASQVDFCSFHKFYPLFNFVGNIELSATQGPALLKRLGIWDKYAANEWALSKVLKSPRPLRGVNPLRYKFPKPEVGISMIGNVLRLTWCIAYGE